MPLSVDTAELLTVISHFGAVGGPSCPNHLRATLHENEIELEWSKVEFEQQPVEYMLEMEVYGPNIPDKDLDKRISLARGATTFFARAFATYGNHSAGPGAAAGMPAAGGGGPSPTSASSFIRHPVSRPSSSSSSSSSSTAASFTSSSVSSSPLHSPPRPPSRIILSAASSPLSRSSTLSQQQQQPREDDTEVFIQLLRPYAVVYRGPNCSFTVKKINTACKYHFRVCSVANTVVSDWSDVVSCVTTTSPLHDILKQRYVFADSMIIDFNKHVPTFEKWFGPDKLPLSSRLLYRGGRDGFQAADFHRLCDHQGPTFTIIKVPRPSVDAEEYIFGGFSPIAWSSPSGLGEYASSSEAWLFSLVNRYQRPVKLTVRKDATATALYHFKACGAIFGCQHDVCISNECGGSGNSFSEPHTYEIDRNVVYVPRLTFRYDDCLLAGARNFRVAEIEVFALTFA